MKDNIQQVVSMLAGETTLKLITATGNVIEMRDDSTYDTARLIKDISPKLTGNNVVEVNLSEYLSVVQALTEPEYEKQGIRITHTVNGQEVQGIFYPQKVSVQVQTSPEEEPVDIPNVENLEKHINRASKENSPAVRNFLKRLAPVVRERRHSAEDLMKFIKKCEMPLTHDGKIIGYKKVQQGTNGDFVDCHSRKITQRIGSRVVMDISGVDPDRNRSCSHGLHVANLGYMRSFGGSHILIVLVDPKDFIAVPVDGGGTKCRVCAYDIIGIITGSAHKLISSSQVAEDATFESLIKDAIEGRYIRPDEVVQVGQQKVLERRPITPEELADPLVQSGLIEVAGENISSEGKSLDKDVLAERGDTREALSEVRGTANKKWLKGPEGLLEAFQDLMEGKKSKAQIARDHVTSTRTLQRWQEKYDFEGFVADRKASAETQPEVQPETKDEEAPVFDVRYTGGKVQIDLIKAVRAIGGETLKGAKERVEKGGLILEKISESQVKNLEAMVQGMPKELAQDLHIVSHGSLPPSMETSGPKTNGKKPSKGSLKDQVQDLYSAWESSGTQEAFDALLAFKKKRKKGWQAIGLSAVQEKKVLKHLKKTGA